LVRRRQKNPAKERSSTEFLRARFDCGGAERAVKVEMNALRAPLTALSARTEKCCYLLRDNADVVIDGDVKSFAERAA
jgi:hypothetical protein